MIGDGECGVAQTDAAPGRLAVQQVGNADEGGAKGIGGPVADLLRSANLFHAAVAHHHDPVDHGHRRALVMGDDNCGDANPVRAHAC